MSWIGNILSGGAEKVIGAIGGAFDQNFTTDEERLKAKTDLIAEVNKYRTTVEESLREELKAKANIIVAELQQGDNFTKRARPSIIYVGLGMMVWNFCLVPTLQAFFSQPVTPFPLPAEFWYGWSAVVSIYAVGRTVEKGGGKGKLLGAVTGGKGSIVDKIL